MQNTEDIKFPIYRKYPNNQRYYKIINKREFEEIQKIGSKTIVNSLTASQLPEFNLINDLITCYNGMALEITEEEYSMALGA